MKRCIGQHYSVFDEMIAGPAAAQHNDDGSATVCVCVCMCVILVNKNPFIYLEIRQAQT